MINLKKRNQKLKTETFVNQYPIILLLQHTSLTVNEWFHLKSQIQHREIPFQFLTTKNSLLKEVLLHNSPFLHAFHDKKKVVERLCQGPNVLVGCGDSEELESLWQFLSSNTKCVFMSCFFKGKILNHLDVERLLKTDRTILNTLLSNLDRKTELYGVLRNTLELHPLLLLQRNMIGVLYLLKQSKTV